MWLTRWQLLSIALLLGSGLPAHGQWSPLNLSFGYGNSVKHMFTDPYSGDQIMLGVITEINGEGYYASAIRRNGQGISGISDSVDINWNVGGNVVAGGSYKGKVFLGGAFPNGLEGSPHPHLAIWDTSGMWATPINIRNAVENISLVDSMLYFAVSTNGGGLNPTCFFTYDGSDWDSVSVEIPSPGSGGFFEAGMVRFGNRYFCGGNFQGNGGSDLFEWLGGNEFVPAWPGQSGAGYISDMLVYRNELVVSGIFSETSGNVANCIAAYNGLDWRPLYNGSGPETNAFSSSILDITVHNGILYAFGFFDSMDGQEANHVAYWDGIEWHGLGDENFVTILCGAIHSDTLFVSGALHLDTFPSQKKVAKYLGDLPSDPNSVWELDEELNMTIYPNPATSTTTLTWQNQNQGSYQITLYDVHGRQLLHRSGTATAGSNTLSIDMSTYAKGIYFGRLVVGEETRSFKVVRE